VILFEYVTATGRAEVSRWRDGLEKPQLGQLDAALDQLESVTDPEDLPGLLAGTNERHIFKLQIGGKIRLRPMVCRGPLGAAEITLLLGATERDGVLVPSDAPQRAGEYRNAILADARRRRPFERSPMRRKKGSEVGHD
jgi:hypothetical protein